MSKLVRQQGVTLVELMIALLLGLVILVVLAQVFLSGRQSFRSQSGLGSVQESGRFALSVLQRQIEMAGFPRKQGVGGNIGVLPALDTVATANNVGPTDFGLGTHGSDSIQVQYTADATATGVLAGFDIRDATRTDCFGRDVVQPTAASPTPINLFVLANNGTLTCRSNNNNVAQPVVAGVEDFQILYGVDTDGDSFANVYWNAAQVNARQINGFPAWDFVVAARVALRVNSQQAMLDTRDATQYAVLDAPPTVPVDDPNTVEDERLFARRVYTSTFLIRNRSVQ